MVDVTDSAADALGVTSEAARHALDAVLADPAGTLLALDFDGTLSPIIDRPEDAVIHPCAAAALDRLGQLIGTVAIITGRPAKAAVDLGRLDQLDGLGDMVVLGQYGAERWDADTGRFYIPPVPTNIGQVESEVHKIIDDLGLRGVSIENKHRAIGVHTRTADDPAGSFDKLVEPVTRIAEENGLRVEPGRSVLEIRPSGRDKGAALAELIIERGARAVIFGGDDLGDVPAFDEVVRQRDAGLPGLLIASASDEQSALVGRADVVRHGPAEVAEWLNALADELERRAA